MLQTGEKSIRGRLVYNLQAQRRPRWINKWPEPIPLCQKRNCKHANAIDNREFLPIEGFEQDIPSLDRSLIVNQSEIWINGVEQSE